MVRAVIAAMLLTLAADADAAVRPAPFEASLQQLRAQLLALKDTEGYAIDAAARELRSQALASWRMRGWISDLARQARQQQNGGRQDPLLASELRRAAWQMRDFTRETERLAREIERLAQAAKPEAALVARAQRLCDDARRLRDDARWLEMDARSASWDFRRAGFSFEAWDIERGASGHSEASRAAESAAAELLRKLSAT